MTDTRIAYGARCTWWDSIQKVGVKVIGRDVNDLHDLPCCPHCHGMLFEVATEDIWFTAAHAAAAQPDNDIPDYVLYLQWLRGKCFPTHKAAYEVYRNDHR